MTERHQDTKKKPVRGAEGDKFKPAGSKPTVATESRRKAAFSRLPTPEHDNENHPHEILTGLSGAMKEEQKPTPTTSAVLRNIRLPNSVKEWEESVKDKIKRLSSDDRKQLRELFNFIGTVECVISKDIPGRNYSIDDLGMRRQGYNFYPFIHLTKRCTCAFNPMEGEHIGAYNTSMASLAKNIQEEWIKLRRQVAEGTKSADLIECALAMDAFELEETDPKKAKKKRV